MSEPTQASVVFVIEALTVGGAEQMLVAMANRFCARNYSVHVVCLTQWGELADQLDDRVQRHVLYKRAGVDVRLALRLRRLIKSINPAAVNSHLFTANFWTRVALLASGLRVVVTEHSRDTWKGSLYRFLDRQLIRSAHRLVAVSNDTADFYRDELGLPAKRVMVINNGIPTAAYASGDGEALRAEWLAKYRAGHGTESVVFVGTVGRLVEAKNHLRLLDAAAQWKSSDNNIVTLIVGDGPLAEKIDKAIIARELTHHVFRLGSRRDVANIVAALDIFVLTSDREGHPLTALEAQASGTPVVLTNAGGCADAIARDGNNAGGILVECDGERVAASITELANDPAKRAAMGQFAKKYAAAHFDLEHMVDSYVEVLLD